MLDFDNETLSLNIWHCYLKYKTLATEKNAEKMFLGTHTIQIKPRHIWMQH